MAYSPVEQGGLVGHAQLVAIAETIGATPAQVALAWTLRQGNVIAIPKAGSVAHVRENPAAGELDLSFDDLTILDRAFPRPRHGVPLEML